MDQRLLEPQKAFLEYEKTFATNTNECFDNYVKESGVDVEENRKTCAKYREENNTVENYSNKVDKYKRLKSFLIFLIVCCFVAGAVMVYQYVEISRTWWYLAITGGAVGVAILLIVLITKKISPIIADSEAQIRRHKSEAEKLLAEAKSQMQPLNILFDSDITRQLVEKTLGEIKLDKSFSMKRYDLLNGKYGYTECAYDYISTLEAMSGEIAGNPFLAKRELMEEMGSETYQGYLDISWVEYHTDSQGNSYSVQKHERLHASVTKPRPYYYTRVAMIYGNEAAPNLSFTHDPSYANTKTESELKRIVAKGAKKLHKIERKDNEFTAMENEEFDVLFNATDRDNETEFRLLFTPLAQKNMLALMKDNVGYGDDFEFLKKNCVNVLFADHAKKWDMDTDSRKYCSYDIDIIEREFKKFQKQYFKHLYFCLAPFLSIPLYQQHKPQEYIYRDNYNSNYTATEAEYFVNQIGRAHFAREDSDLDRADVICKTELLNKMDDCDKVMVTGYSYKTREMVDYVPVYGGDGYTHNVPVEWIEYIPIQCESSLFMKAVDMSERDYYDRILEIDDVAPNAFMHGIFAITLDQGSSVADINSAINTIFKK